MNLRELLWMVRGKQREAWSHTSVLLAKLHNCHVAKSHQAKRPEDFNPVYQAERRAHWRPASRTDVQRIKALIPTDRKQRWPQPDK